MHYIARPQLDCGVLGEVQVRGPLHVKSIIELIIGDGNDVFDSRLVSNVDIATTLIALKRIKDSNRKLQRWLTKHKL